jgi:hypothetical protein
MTSTYSPNLQIELMGNGDQAGNWGATTNTNLGTLIEQAIAGYATYNCTGGTDTLSMTSGASATARNMYIQLNGTGGGTVIMPGTSPNANTKLYYIFNNTASAITVKVSGQTGVSVPAAAKIELVCNGTDIVSATNYMISPTFNSPTLTGTPVAPTPTYGTNTTQLATAAFVQAALQALYPIGSIYASTVSTNPATLFGFGTWVAYASGQMLIGQNGTYTAGSTGGSATTTLSVANMPSHTHTYSGTTDATDLSGTFPTATTGGGYSGKFTQNYTYSGNGSDPQPNANVAFAGNHTHTYSGTTNANGSGTAVTTISPYVAVYMWNRTA